MEPGIAMRAFLCLASCATATLQQQADGSVRVQFGSRAAREADLITRVSRCYERRMGR
jgi:hypothetical protein